MVDAYMSWSTTCTHAGDHADTSGGASYSMTVYDTFGKFLSISPVLCAYVLYVASYKVVLDVLPDDPNLPSALCGKEPYQALHQNLLLDLQPGF